MPSIYVGISLGAIALSYPTRVRVRATVKLSVAFFHGESSLTIGGEGYESAIAPIPAPYIACHLVSRYSAAHLKHSVEDLTVWPRI